MFRSSTASSTSESVIFSKGLSPFLSSRTDNCDFTTCVSSYTGIVNIDQDLILSQA